MTPRNTYAIGVNSVNQWLANFQLRYAPLKWHFLREMAGEAFLVCGAE